MARIRSRSPLSAAIAALGAGVLGIYHKSARVARSGATFVSWDDVRGASGFGVQLVPNGGLGGTAPTIDPDGSIVTDGVASFLANAAASATFPLDATARTLIVWGEFLGTPASWGGLVDSLTAPTQRQVLGWSGGFQLVGPPVTVAKAQPGAGVRSMLVMTQNAPYTWQGGASQSPKTSAHLELVGRGPSVSVPAVNNVGASVFATDPTYSVGSGFLSLGRDGSTYGQVKICGIISLSRMLRYADRVAIETLMGKTGLADNVSLFGAAGSRGAIIPTGDSVTAGAYATTLAFQTPADPAATHYPSHLQLLLNNAGKAIDVAPWGTGGQSLFSMLATGGVTNWIQDRLAFCSPARRAAGLKEILHLNWGTNDIGHYTRTGAQVYADIVTAVALIHAAGSKASVGTVIPRGNFFGTANETERKNLNTLIRANTAGADAVVDYTAYSDAGTLCFADPGGTDTITNNATYYRPYPTDGTHLVDDGTSTARGYAMMANALYAALNAAGLI